MTGKVGSRAPKTKFELLSKEVKEFSMGGDFCLFRLSDNEIIFYGDHPEKYFKNESIVKKTEEGLTFIKAEMKI